MTQREVRALNHPHTGEPGSCPISRQPKPEREIPTFWATDRVNFRARDEAILRDAFIVAGGTSFPASGIPLDDGAYYQPDVSVLKVALRTGRVRLSGGLFVRI